MEEVSRDVWKEINDKRARKKVTQKLRDYRKTHSEGINSEETEMQEETHLDGHDSDDEEMDIGITISFDASIGSWTEDCGITVEEREAWSISEGSRAIPHVLCDPFGVEY